MGGWLWAKLQLLGGWLISRYLVIFLSDYLITRFPLRGVICV
jgi:hypothetical protein